MGARRAGAPLLAPRPALDRSGADDPDAHPRLRVRHPLGTAAVPRGAGEPGLSVVLRPEHRGQGPGSLGVLARPQRALPRQRHLPARVRAGGGGVHRGRSRRRRRLRGRCQPDRGGRQQAALDPRQGLGQEARSGDGEPGGEGVSGNARRRGLRRGERRDAEVRLAVRSGRAVDGRDARTGLLRLRRQLPDRREVRRHHGCGSLPAPSARPRWVPPRP